MKRLVGLTLFALVNANVRQPKVHSDAVYSCPETFVLQGKKCVRQSHVLGNKVCRTGNLLADRCVLNSQPQNYCPPNTVNVPAGCEMKEIAYPDVKCPPGAHDIGGECLTYNVSGIVELCENGAFENGECAVYEFAPPIRKAGCPRGYRETKGSCWKSQAMDCTQPYAGKRNLNALSEEKIELLPEFQSKYAPGTAKLHIKQKLCEVKLESKPIEELSCPPDTTLMDGRCATKKLEPTVLSCSLGEDYKCFPTQVIPGIKNCPSGYQIKKNICERSTIVTRENRCVGSDYPGTNGACIHVVGEPITSCPPGSQLSGDVCIKQDVVEPKVQVTTTCSGKDCYK